MVKKEDFILKKRKIKFKQPYCLIPNIELLIEEVSIIKKSHDIGLA